jgi:hypothetical protein
MGLISSEFLSDTSFNSFPATSGLGSILWSTEKQGQLDSCLLVKRHRSYKEKKKNHSKPHHLMELCI